MTTTFVSKQTFLPTGLPPANINAISHAVEVTYRGHYVKRGAEDMGEVAWYSVDHFSSQLSRAGNWGWMIQPFQRWQYRFTLDEALDWAAEVVDSVKVNGMTWAEWQEWRRANRPLVTAPSSAG